MKTLKQIGMRSFSDAYRKLFKDWPDHLSDFIVGLICMFAPIYMLIIWPTIYFYRQYKYRGK